MNPIACPVCGSTDVRQERRSEIVSVPYGENTSVRLRLDVCGACGMDGDFEGSNDAVVEGAYKTAANASIVAMLGHLAGSGLSLAYMERALDLPQRTLARWKQGECSASGVAVLRMVRTFPWLLGVAEGGYDPHEAEAALIRNSVEKLLAHAQRHGATVSVDASTDSAVNIQVSKQVNAPTGQPRGAMTVLPGET